jgi:hypothetical protein
VSSTGDLGVNTGGTQATKLHVIGGNVWSGNFYEVARFQKSSGTAVSLGFDNTAYVATIGAYSHDGTASNLSFWTYPGSGSVEERLRITSAGLVGVGTSAPSQALNVVGNIALGATLTGGVNGTAYSILGNSATSGNANGGSVNIVAGAGSGAGTNGNISISAGSTVSPASVTTGGSVLITSGKPSDAKAGGTIDFRYYSGNPSTLATAMCIDSSGRVGIGTTSPLFPLDVNGVIYTRGRGSTFGVLFDDWRIYNSTAPGALVFDNGSERARIDSSGRLLVGTSSERTNVYYTTVATTPKVQFETSGSSYSNGLSLIQYSASGFSPVLTLGLSASNTPGTNTAIASTHDLGAINFAGNDGTNFRTGASIICTNDQASAWAVGDCPGRLVFSTTADGAASPTERMRISSAGVLSAGGTSTDDNFGSASFSNYNTDNAAPTASFNTAASSSGTGNVLIRFWINNFGAGSGMITANGASAAAFGSFSDARLKENIEDLPSQWDKIKSLRPVEFDYIETFGGGHQIGFVAQEMQAVYPDAVGIGDNEMLTVTAWSKTEARLVKALQEAIARIETLEAEVAALKGA